MGAPDVAEQQAAARAMGLHYEPPATPAIELWPENAAAARMFELVQSQWRMGPGGPVGLDYSVLPPWLRPGCGGRRVREVLIGLQVMEAEALRAFSERRAKAEH
jgi:hypothetical protein